MSDQTPQRKINLRKYSRPKPQRKPTSPANDFVRSQPPSPIPSPTLSATTTTTTPPPSPTRPSTAESFRRIYTDKSNKLSYSGNIQDIANQIKSYRLERRFSPY